MFKITSHCGGIAQTNGYLLRGDDLPTLLIDAPEGAAGWLKSKGIGIDALLLTHLHYDHVLDAAAVQKDHDCSVYAWEPECTPDLTLDSIYRAMGMPLDVPAFDITHPLKGQSECTVEGLDFRLFHIPGHSLDSVCFLPEGPEDAESVVFGGDVLFNGSVGRVDFPGGSMELLADGIRKHLFTLADETVVYPGHGPETTVGEEKRSNPYVR